MSYYAKKTYGTKSSYPRKYASKPRYASTTTVVKKKYAPRRRQVMNPDQKMYNRTEQGMVNGFVPATTTARFFGKCRYGASAITFTASTGLAGSYVYSANGMFDPSVTGGALQPAGFAQLMSLYEHYTVYRSKMTVTFTNNSTTPTMASLSLQADVSAISTDTNNVLELPYSQLVQLEGSPSYGSSKTLSMTCNCSKYFGVPVTKANSIYRGDVISNPQEQVYFRLSIFGLKGGSAEVFVTVKIEYQAIFTEPRELSPTLQNQLMNLVIAEQHSEHVEVKKSELPEIKIPAPGLLSGIFS